jgi:hypothetical protein
VRVSAQEAHAASKKLLAFAQQPGARGLPVSLHGIDGGSESVGDLLVLQAAEELHLHPALSRIQAAQGSRASSRRTRSRAFAEPTSPISSNEEGGHGEEVLPVFESGVAVGYQTQVRLVHQSSALQGMAGTLMPQHSGSSAPQFCVDHRDELRKRVPVAGSPTSEKRGHAGVGHFGHWTSRRSVPTCWIRF